MKDKGKREEMGWRERKVHVGEVKGGGWRERGRERERE